MSTFEEQIEAATIRYQGNTSQREHRLHLLAENKPFKADSPDRVHRWFRRRGFDAATAERAIVDGKVPPELEKAMAPAQDDIGLERVLGTTDFLGVAFLETALRVSRSVCRVAIGGATGSPIGYGTGFLVSPRLLMTNNHVLGDATTARRSVAEFDYYVRADGVPASMSVFALEPDTFFITDEDLDITLVAVAPRGTGNVELARYGWNQLIAEEGKAIVGQWVNIVQHPNGEPKQLVLRNNEIIDLPGAFLHYKADTSPGSSGSPVFNDRWEVIALHHSGVPERDANGKILDLRGKVWQSSQGDHQIKWKANEGARISRILQFLNATPLDSVRRALADECRLPPPLVSTESRNTPLATPAPTSSPACTMQPDGTATWVLPLTVSVRFGDGQVGARVPAGNVLASTAATTAPADAAATNVSVTNLKDENAVLDAARRVLAGRRDVLDVRLGYKFVNGWITGERALVVKVAQKKSQAELRREGVAALPASFGGYPVQISGPTLHDLVQQSDGFGESMRRTFELRTEEITYQPPQNAPLRTVDESMRATFHVSPDAGWPQLQRFIEETKSRLTIGMYDFGAPHIVDAIEALSRKQGFKNLTLVMQRGQSVGEGTKKDDLTDQEVVDRLQDAFANEFKFRWIKIGIKNGWVASSYHIKVAVRDRAAFWLSSGNFQSSNQPAVDLSGSSDFSFLKKYNREWHAIIEHEGLAKNLETYLKHDFDNGAVEDFEERFAQLPTIELPLAEKFRGPAHPDFRYFPDLSLERRLRVTPLLTPDNYFDQLLKLVRSARREILIQNQTFNAPKETHLKLTELMELLVEKQRRMKVRIIFRLLHAPTVRENLEGLKDLGFDTDEIKVQSGLHTKGVIVDGKTVLLGSQNISEQGISINRDASLLIEDEEVAQYFKKIFQHDWDNLGQQDIGAESTRRRGEDADERVMLLTPKEYLALL